MELTMPMTQGRDLPAITVREIDLPEIKTWEIGGEYYILSKVKLVTKGNNVLRMDMDDNDQSKQEATLLMLTVKALDKKPVSLKDLEEQEYREIYAKARSGEI